MSATAEQGAADAESLGELDALLGVDVEQSGAGLANSAASIDPLAALGRVGERVVPTASRGVPWLRPCVAATPEDASRCL